MSNESGHAALVYWVEYDRERDWPGHYRIEFEDGSIVHAHPEVAFAAEQ